MSPEVKKPHTQKQDRSHSSKIIKLRNQNQEKHEIEPIPKKKHQHQNKLERPKSEVDVSDSSLTFAWSGRE